MISSWMIGLILIAFLSLLTNKANAKTNKTPKMECKIFIYVLSLCVFFAGRILQYLAWILYSYIDIFFVLLKLIYINIFLSYNAKLIK